MKRFFLFAWLCISSLAGFSQQTPDFHILPPSEYVPPTPTAASLGQYIDQKVDLHTGVPEISIPLFEVSTGDYSMPITLSYHAGGHQVRAAASWVGLGWSLSAGGVVNRTIRSLEDKPASDPNSYIAFKNRPNGIMLSPTIAADYILLTKISKGLVDTAPDLYSFTIPSASGKFMVLENGAKHMVPSQPIKVSCPINNPQSIEITDAQGAKHRFWASDAEVSDSKSGATGEATSRISSFMLSQIITPKLRDINFFYKDSEFIPDVSISMSMEYRLPPGGGIPQPFSETPQYSGSNELTKGKTLDHIVWNGGSVIFHSSLERLDVVKADPEKGDYRLDSIEVFSESKLVKKYRLNYGYFNEGSPDIGKRRLKLVSLVEVNLDGNGEDIVQQFVYNESMNLPSRGSFQFDHWGYYNGMAQALPVFNSDGSVNMSLKEPSLNHAKANILTDIIHPTKGKTTFEYELNDYYDDTYIVDKQYFSCLAINNVFEDVAYFNVYPGTQSVQFETSVIANYGVYANNGVDIIYPPGDDGSMVFKQSQNGLHTFTPGFAPQSYIVKCKIDDDKNYAEVKNGVVTSHIYQYTRSAGGLRVKSIRKRSFDGSPDLITNYSYKGDNGYSSGVRLKALPVYYRTKTHYENTYPVGDLLYCKEAKYNHAVTYTGLNPSDFAPSPVGYRTVTVTKGDGNENGKTIHTFNINDYGMNDLAWMYGQQLTEKTYNADNVLLSSTENFYTTVNDAVPAVTAVSVEQIGAHYCAEDYTFNSSYPRDYEQTYSTHIQGWVKLDKTISKSYHPEPGSGTQTEVTKTTEYSYDTFHQVNLITEGVGSNQKIVTKFEYPQDRHHDAIYQQMLAANQVTELVSKTAMQQDGTDTGTRKILSKAYVKHANITVGANSIPVVESQYELETLSPLAVSTTIPEGPCAGPPCFEKQITMQYGNPSLDPVLVTDKTGQNFSMIWGHYHDLTAQVVNAKPDQVAFTSFEVDLELDTVLGGWDMEYRANVQHTLPAPKTGDLSSSQIRIAKKNLPKGDYILGYYVRGNGTLEIKNVGATSNTTNVSVNESEWKYKTIQLTVDHLTPANNKISIMANVGVYIDDVRLHPVGATMKTFSQDRFIGLRAVSDENGVTNYYHYDGLNRLLYITDDKKSIVQTFEYNLKK